jgi:hypothetical protein
MTIVASQNLHEPGAGVLRSRIIKLEPVNIHLKQIMHQCVFLKFVTISAKE